MEMADVIRKLAVMIEEQREMRKHVDDMIDNVRHIREEIAKISGAKIDAKALLPEFCEHVTSMSDDDVRASIQNAERLTAGCDIGLMDGGAADA